MQRLKNIRLFFLTALLVLAMPFVGFGYANMASLVDQAQRLSSDYFSGKLDADGYHSGIHALRSQADKLSTEEQEQLRQWIATIFSTQWAEYMGDLTKRINAYRDLPNENDERIFREMFVTDPSDILPQIRALKPHIDYLGKRGVYLFSKGWVFAHWATLWPHELEADPDLVTALRIFFPKEFVAMLMDKNRTGPLHVDKFLQVDEERHVYIGATQHFVIKPPPKDLDRQDLEHLKRVLTYEKWEAAIAKEGQGLTRELAYQSRTANQQGLALTGFSSELQEAYGQSETNTDKRFEGRLANLEDLGFDPEAFFVEVKGQQVAITKAWDEVKEFQEAQKASGKSKRDNFLIASAVAAGTAVIVIVTAPVSVPTLVIGTKATGTFVVSSKAAFFGATAFALTVGTGVAAVQALGDTKYTDQSFGIAFFEHFIANSTLTLYSTPLFAAVALAPTITTRLAMRFAGPSAGPMGEFLGQQSIRLLNAGSAIYLIDSALGSFSDSMSTRRDALSLEDPVKRNRVLHQSWNQMVDGVTDTIYAFALGHLTYKAPPRIGIAEPPVGAPGVIVGQQKMLPLELYAGGRTPTSAEVFTAIRDLPWPAEFPSARPAVRPGSSPVPDFMPAELPLTGNARGSGRRSGGQSQDPEWNSGYENFIAELQNGPRPGTSFETWSGRPSSSAAGQQPNNPGPAIGQATEAPATGTQNALLLDVQATAKPLVSAKRPSLPTPKTEPPTAARGQRSDMGSRTTSSADESGGGASDLAAALVAAAIPKAVEEDADATADDDDKPGDSVEEQQRELWSRTSSDVQEAFGHDFQTWRTAGMLQSIEAMLDRIAELIADQLFANPTRDLFNRPYDELQAMQSAYEQALDLLLRLRNIGGNDGSYAQVVREAFAAHPLMQRFRDTVGTETIETLEVYLRLAILDFDFYLVSNGARNFNREIGQLPRVDIDTPRIESDKVTDVYEISSSRWVLIPEIPTFAGIDASRGSQGIDLSYVYARIIQAMWESLRTLGVEAVPANAIVVLTNRGIGIEFDALGQEVGLFVWGNGKFFTERSDGTRMAEEPPRVAFQTLAQLNEAMARHGFLVVIPRFFIDHRGRATLVPYVRTLLLGNQTAVILGLPIDPDASLEMQLEQLAVYVERLEAADILLRRIIHDTRDPIATVAGTTALLQRLRRSASEDEAAVLRRTAELAKTLTDLVLAIGLRDGHILGQEYIRETAGRILVIVGALQNLDRSDMDERQRNLYDAAIRQLVYIRDLLQMFGTRDISLHPQALSEALTYAMALLQPAIEEAGASMTLDVQADVDLEALQALTFIRIVRNLVHNALDATRGRAESLGVVIRVSLQSTAEGDRYVMEVIDNAGGIPDAILQRGATAEGTTTSGDRARGLGLGICRQAAQELPDGSFEIDVTPGVGTRFVVRFSPYTGGTPD